MRRVGFALLLLVIVAVVAYQLLGKGKGAPGGLPAGPGAPSSRSGPATTIKGLVGGEKMNLLADPDVQKILRDRYGLTVDAGKAGSIEMVKGDPAGQDFLWPGSQVALEIYKERKGKLARDQVIFNSPIVLYSWDQVTQALVKAGVVHQEGSTYYVKDFPGLVKMIVSGKQWKEIGLPDLYGRVAVYSTDPVKSNSGNQFAGLLASTLNGGEVPTEQSIGKVLPEVRSFFDRLGFLEPSSEDLFNRFLTTGMGDKPMIVGYEAQLVEFSLQNPQYRDLLRKRINILYPKPTVWSSHPLIALDENGTKLLTALQDKELQRLAWEKHGFRSGLIGVQNDPKVLQLTGIPETIQNVIPMPTARVMDRIIQALSTK